MKKETVAIRIILPEELRAAFKAQCALKGTNMNEQTIRLIEEWLKSEGVSYDGTKES